MILVSMDYYEVMEVNEKSLEQILLKMQAENQRFRESDLNRCPFCYPIPIKLYCSCSNAEMLEKHGCQCGSLQPHGWLDG